jgi:hypothetical protein
MIQKRIRSNITNPKLDGIVIGPNTGFWGVMRNLILHSQIENIPERHPLLGFGTVPLSHGDLFPPEFAASVP